MGALNYIAYVVFAVLFISLAFGIYAQYQRGAAEQEFMSKAEELAGMIRQLGEMNVGSSFPFKISVPQNCELSFADNSVIISIGSWSDNFPVGIAVSGPTFSAQNLKLRLERVGNGVNVSVWGNL